MAHISGSSGDPAADRRFEMAQTFIEMRDYEAAADLMRQALALAPRWPEGQFTLAETLMRANHAEAAIAAFQTYLALDPADSMGAHAKLAQLGAASATAELPRAYVERLFDQYAPRFESALVGGLKYSAPQQIRAAIDAHFPARRFAHTLDLGCGTGLMGVAIRDLTAKLSGVDLSASMIGEAKRKNIYDALLQDDVVAVLHDKQNTYDLILAADVFVYLGDLSAVMHAAHTALMPGGVLAFTLQATTETDYRLGADQRFSHSADYVKKMMAGFRVLSISPGSFRRERNADVPGLLVLAEKSA